MKRTNCPNCGGPLPVGGHKCEFCGTRIIDLTMIDFDNDEPTMFLLNLPRSITGGQKAMISMWARPELNSITVESSYVDVYGDKGYDRSITVPGESQVAFEMALRPLADPRDWSVCKLKIDK